VSRTFAPSERSTVLVKSSYSSAYLNIIIQKLIGSRYNNNVTKINLIIKNNSLFFAFFFPALMDGTATFLGQGSEYWNTVRVINEASPAYYFLLASPWLFLLGSVAWFIFWYWLFKKLREPFNLFLMFLFIAGHSWGSGGWIMKMFKQAGIYTLGNQPSIIFAWSLLIGYFLLIAGIATYCLRIYLTTNKSGGAK